jgi:hypothetical protein
MLIPLAGINILIARPKMREIKMTVGAPGKVEQPKNTRASMILGSNLGLINLDKTKPQINPAII